jgi:hypothetical protein
MARSMRLHVEALFQILNHEGKPSSRDPVVLDDHDRYRMGRRIINSL